MKFVHYGFGLAAILFPCAGSVFAQTTTSTAPSSSTQADTPMEFMQIYDRLAGADPDELLPLYSINDNDDRKLATAEARFDAEVGMLQKIVQLRWGDEGVNQAIHALGIQTADDIRTAKVTETGDRATVTYADGTAGPMLVKTAAGWRLDTAAFRKALGMPVSDYIKQLHTMSSIVADVADSIDQKNLRTVDAVSHEIAERMARIAK